VHVVGYPLAYALVRSPSALIRSTILVIVVTPLFLGEVVRTYSWIVVLGNNGFVNSVLIGLGLIRQPLQLMFTTFGVVLALVHVTLPVMVIMLAPALAHIDRNYERAAESLGAGPIRAFLTVTLPLSTPGIVAGVSTAFAWTFSAFATPQLIGGGRVNMIANLVYQLGFASFNFPFAASLSVAGLALAVAVLVLMRAITRPLEKLG
jgi:putative spermidine/putrescine transport system permease protein